jgi:polysaccharide export outer membrane protein
VRHLFNPFIIAALMTPVLALAQQNATPQTDLIRPTYVLGAGDQIVIRATDVEEISDKPFRVDGDGFITLPLLGRIRAGGLSVQALEADLIERLKAYVRMPQVIITVAQFRSEPVFFVGAFKTPGIYPLLGKRTLVEMLASIGGLQPNASRRIKVTRRDEFGRIPLSNAIEDPVNKVSAIEISMGSLRENVNPAEDIVLQPYDVISVERAEMVYINGEVGKVGPVELGERDSISVAQAITLAGGLSKNANARKARVLRPVLNSSRRAEIQIDLTKILKGETNDFPLQPNDVLYVPGNSGASRKILTAATVVGIPLIPTLIYLAVR